MAEIVNLRRFRKARRRDDAAVTADQNRVQFGQRKADRTLNAALTKLDGRKLDGRRLDVSEPARTQVIPDVAKPDPDTA